MTSTEDLLQTMQSQLNSLAAECGYEWTGERYVHGAATRALEERCICALYSWGCPLHPKPRSWSAGDTIPADVQRVVGGQSGDLYDRRGNFSWWTPRRTWISEVGILGDDGPVREVVAQDEPADPSPDAEDGERERLVEALGEWVPSSSFLIAVMPLIDAYAESAYDRGRRVGYESGFADGEAAFVVAAPDITIDVNPADVLAAADAARAKDERIAATLAWLDEQALVCGILAVESSQDAVRMRSEYSLAKLRTARDMLAGSDV